MYSKKVSRRGFIQSGAAGFGAMAAAGLPAGPKDWDPQVSRASGFPSGLPVLDTVDVLVAGGGPAGIGAALGAARTGAKTLVIENCSFFGGVGAWMMGMEINQMRPGGKPRSDVHELLIEKIAAYGDQALSIGDVNGHELWVNVEYLKVAILDAFDAVGAKYLVHVRAVDAVMDGNRITGVVVGTKRGLMVIKAKTVVDCTGDGDVAFFTGAETMIDPKSLMPMTLGLALANVDKSLKSADISAAIKAGRAKHPLIPKGWLEIRPIVHSSSWFINHSGTADWGRMDATDPVERTKAECQSRRQALQMAQALREADDPAVGRIEWVAAGPQVSVRESRRVKGLYILIEEDTRTGRSFDDAIAWRSGLMDPGGEIGGPGGRMKTFDVPYRSLVPERIDGLLVAGRCISATHVAAAAAKSMGNCVAIGHAAALACVQAIGKGIKVRDVSVPELQAKLKSEGVDLEVTRRNGEFTT